jgi:hypothetical protein
VIGYKLYLAAETTPPCQLGSDCRETVLSAAGSNCGGEKRKAGDLMNVMFHPSSQHQGTRPLTKDERLSASPFGQRRRLGL